MLQQALAFQDSSSSIAANSASRRYVDKHVDSAKKSHRRAVSLSFHANESVEGRGPEKHAQRNASGVNLPSSNSASAGVASSTTPEVKRRIRRAPQTMRPSLSSASSASPSSFSVVKRKPKDFTPLGKVGERLSHRRANSWDPRNDERRKSDAGESLEVALANRKGKTRDVVCFFFVFVLKRENDPLFS